MGSEVKVEVEYSVKSQGCYKQPWLDHEGGAYMLTGHAARMPDGRIVVWTHSDEAGIDDVEIVGEAEILRILAREHARGIAGMLGTLARRSDDRHHYTRMGYQECPYGYDRDGYFLEYVPE